MRTLAGFDFVIAFKSIIAVDALILFYAIPGRIELENTITGDSPYM